MHYKLTRKAEAGGRLRRIFSQLRTRTLVEAAIQARLKTIDSQMLQETIHQVATDFVLTQELLDENLAHLVVNGLDHGADSRDIIRAIEVGYRRLGLIE